MANRPMSVIGGSVLGVVGGITTIAALTHDFSFSINEMTCIGLYLLTTVLFFATAGFLYSNGKGNYISLVFLELINVAVISAHIVIEPDEKVFGIALLALALLQTIFSLPQGVEKWVARDRV